MRWLAATVGLLCASAGVIAWVYLRDRDTASWRPPEAQFARVAGADTLAALDPARCRTGCGVEVLSRRAPGRWLVRVRVVPRGRPQCLQIDLETFAVGRVGLSGVRPGRCPRASRTTLRRR
jgi:hypothetical protein